MVNPPRFSPFLDGPPRLPHPVQAEDAGRAPAAGQRQGARLGAVAVEHGGAIAWEISQKRMVESVLISVIHCKVYLFILYIYIIIYIMSIHFYIDTHIFIL